MRDFGEVIGRVCRFTRLEAAVTGMPGQPIARPGDGVFVGIEMINQPKHIAPMLALAAREVVKLAIGVNNQRSAVGPKSAIAVVIGDSARGNWPQYR